MASEVKHILTSQVTTAEQLASLINNNEDEDYSLTVELMIPGVGKHEILLFDDVPVTFKMEITED